MPYKLPVTSFGLPSAAWCHSCWFPLLQFGKTSVGNCVGSKHIPSSSITDAAEMTVTCLFNAHASSIRASFLVNLLVISPSLRRCAAADRKPWKWRPVPRAISLSNCPCKFARMPAASAAILIKERKLTKKWGGFSKHQPCRSTCQKWLRTCSPLAQSHGMATL